MKPIFPPLFFSLLLVLLNVPLMATEQSLTPTLQPAVLNNNETLSYQLVKKNNSNKLLWVTHQKLNLSGLSLVSLLNDLGLRVLPLTINSNEHDLTAIDRQLTSQLVYIATLFNGYQFKPKENPQEEIIAAVINKTLANYVDQLLPQFDEVVRLRSAIAKYRQLSSLPWPSIAEKFNPQLGQGHQEITKLRAILSALGDIDNSKLSNFRQHIFDPEVIEALKHFQTRHGLKATGILDNKTRLALAITPKQRIEIMQANLWRWLSLPSHPPQRYLQVNIPSYHLSLIENNQQTLAMKVIVGDKQHPTPIMVTEINSVTINPTWTPTYNIVNNELLPQNTRDPGSLKRQNFKLAKGAWHQQVFREIEQLTTDIKKLLPEYHLVQAAGENNALGKHRFNIKNHHSVYLHDTPVKNLFSKSNRALSHGCIRLQFSGLLAEAFLASENKLKQQVRNASQSGDTSHIRLSSNIPVYITYQTVWVAANGKINWRDDIYQLDQGALIPTIIPILIPAPKQIITTAQSDAILGNTVLAHF